MLIFLDTETTGLEIEDKICSIGMIYSKNSGFSTEYELINEGKKIPPKASSIHHITNQMIKDKKSFNESSIYKFLEANNSTLSTLVVHNAAFHLEKLAQSGLVWKGGVIDTLRVTKHLIPECEEFDLQVLRYELQLYKDEKNAAYECGIKDAIDAHHALSDALVIKQLYEYLNTIVQSDEMMKLSFQKVLLIKFTFGKYSGKYIEEIAMNDRAYLEWMLNLSDLDEDLRYSIEYYLEG